MKYEIHAADRLNMLAAQRELLREPSEDRHLTALFTERERCLDRLTEIESELWDEYGLVPD